jgi:hypothetical protein
MGNSTLGVDGLIRFSAGTNELPAVPAVDVCLCNWLYSLRGLCSERVRSTAGLRRLCVVPSCFPTARVRQVRLRRRFRAGSSWCTLTHFSPFFVSAYYAQPTGLPSTFKCLKCPSDAVTCLNGRIINPADTWCVLGYPCSTA